MPTAKTYTIDDLNAQLNLCKEKLDEVNNNVAKTKANMEKLKDMEEATESVCTFHAEGKSEAEKKRNGKMKAEWWKFLKEKETANMEYLVAKAKKDSLDSKIEILRTQVSMEKEIIGLNI